MTLILLIFAFIFHIDCLVCQTLIKLLLTYLLTYLYLIHIETKLLVTVSSSVDAARTLNGNPPPTRTCDKQMHL